MSVCKKKDEDRSYILQNASEMPDTLRRMKMKTRISSPKEGVTRHVGSVGHEIGRAHV